jgi:hypothetical protein
LLLAAVVAAVRELVELLKAAVAVLVGFALALV